MKGYLNGKAVPTERGAQILAKDIYEYVLAPEGW
jgi:hypothetical protein